MPTTPTVRSTLLTHAPGTGTPHRLGDTATFDACSVLPMSAVTGAGIELEPQGLTRQDVMERDAPGDPAWASRNLEGLTNCTWPGVHQQSVALQIYQPPYSHDRDRTGRLEFLDRRGATPDSMHGLDVYTINGGFGDPKDWQVSFFAAGYWALLLVKLAEPGRRDVVDRLTGQVAGNLGRGPTGPSTFGYGQPYADVADPCALFTREDFQRHYGSDDVGRVTVERSAGELPLLNDDGRRTRFIRLACTRRAPGTAFNDKDAPGLRVQFDVFADAAGAELMEYGRCDPASSGHIFGPPRPVAAPVGDGRTCLPNEGRDNRPLVFRAGRTVVALYNWRYADASDLDALAAKLTPIGHSIAARLVP